MRRLGSLLGGLVLAAVLALAAVMLVPAALGYERYVITTGSMTGTYDPGSMIFDRVVPVSTLRTGDVITYDPPPEAEFPGVVTHRITSIRAATSTDLGARPGQPIIQTKGDANDAPDGWRFTPTSASLPRVEAGIPYVGHAYAKLDTRAGRVAIFAVPGLLIAFSVLAGLWKEAGAAARREAAEAAGLAEPDERPDDEVRQPTAGPGGAPGLGAHPSPAPVPGTATAVGAVPVGAPGGSA